MKNIITELKFEQRTVDWIMRKESANKDRLFRIITGTKTKKEGKRMIKVCGIYRIPSSE